MPPCRAGAALPGRFAETLDSGPQDNWKKIPVVLPVGGQLEKNGQVAVRSSC